MIATLKNIYVGLVSDQGFSEILTGSVWAMVAQVGATAVGLVTSIVVARYYGAEAMGILAVINSFLVLVAIFTVLGTPTSVLRLVPEHIAKYSTNSAFRVYRKIQGLVAGVSVVMGGIFIIGAGVIAEHVFSKPHLSFLFSLAAVFVLFRSLLDLNTNAARGLRLIRTFAFFQVFPTLAMLMALLGLTFLAPHPDTPVYAQLTAFAITGLASAWIMDRAFKARVQPGDLVKPVPTKEILAISFPMLLTASMHFLIGQTGVVMLGMFRTEAEVGYFSVAVRMAGLSTFVLAALNAMAGPTFSSLFHTGKTEELFRVARKVSKLVFWTTVPILVALLALGKPILAMLFGEEFRSGYVAMALLALGQFVNSASGSTNFFMNMTGHEAPFRNIVFAAAVLSVLLGFILIPRFGVEGAAIAGMTSMAFWNLATLAFIKRKFGRTIGYLPYLSGA